MSDEPVRPHKPVAAIAAIFCVFNGALLYLTSLDFTGDGGTGTSSNEKQEQEVVIENKKTVYFETSGNQIKYMGKEISFEEFRQLAKEAQNQQKIPEVFFGEDTTNGLHQRMIYFFKHNEITYRQIQKKPTEK